MRAIALLNIAVKLVLVGAIVFMLTHPDLPQFENKSLTLRAVIYPIFALLVPTGYYLKGMRGEYPHLLDLLWSATFTFDIVSNDAHLYGSYANYDDFIHFVNAIPYTFLLVGILLSLERLGRFRLGYAGAVLAAFTAFVAFHAVWEMYEHSMDRFFGTNLQPGGMTEATDNNTFAIVGALLAIAILHYWRRARSFEAYLVAPTSDYLRRLLVRRQVKVESEAAGRSLMGEELQAMAQER